MADGWVLGDRYRVQDRLGSGGMAEVFRAHDELLDRAVAVKVFRTTHVSADAPAGVARQQTELQALARLNHPNLITLYDGSVTNIPAYLVMELVEGPSLGARIAQGPLPEPEVREIGAQLADGLAYVHAQGMVHRDVKPDNILLGIDRSDEDSTVRARLSDFGIVRLLGAERMTSVDFTLGTASYLAPEQARGSGVDPPADVYSLALVLLEALTGQRSFEGPPLEAAIARLSNRPGIPSSLPAPWPGLLFAMTELDPAARPTAAQVARVLRTNASDTTTFIPAAGGALASAATQMFGSVPAGAAVPPASGPPMPPVAPRSAGGPIGPPPEDEPRRNGLLITAGVLALIVIIAGVVLAIILSGSGDSPSAGTSTTPSTTSSKSSKPATKSSTKRSSKPRSSRASSSAAPSITSSSRSSSSSSTAPSSSSTAPSSSASTSSTSKPPSSASSTPTTSKPPSSASSTSTTASNPASSPAVPLGDPPVTSASKSASRSAAPTP